MWNDVVGVSNVFFFAVRLGPGKCGQNVGFVSAFYLWAVNAQTRKCEISGAVPIFSKFRKSVLFAARPEGGYQVHIRNDLRRMLVS